MEWLNLSTKEEFKEYATEKYKKSQLINIKKEINSDIVKAMGNIDKSLKGVDEIIKIKAGSWDILSKKIKVLKELLKEINPSEGVIEIPDTTDEFYISPYFKSQGDELIFYILELSGKKRNDMLGVKEIFYKDKAKANKWRKEILMKIHPDICKNPKAAEALIQLEQLYEAIII